MDNTHTAYGSLPDGPPDAKNLVTSAQTTPDVPRSVGGVAAVPAVPAPTMFGGSPFIPTTFSPPPSFAGSMAPPSLHSGAPKSAPQKAMAQNPSISSNSYAFATSTWDVTDASVPTLPEFHPLERSATFVPHTTAPTVARRVVKALQSRSIESAFFAQKAKAKCMTVDNVEFRIRLYRGKNKFDHGVIVEVQRRYGFSPSFQADVTAILDAAEGKVSTAADAPAPSFLPPPELVSSDEEDSGKSALEIASDLICDSDTIDGRALGLQSLASLTDDKVVGSIRSHHNSEKVLSGENNSVQTILMDLLSPDASMDHSLSDQKDAIRVHAMKALCNVTRNIHKAGNNDEANHHKEYFLDTVLPVLIKEIGKASTCRDEEAFCLQRANLAADALHYLLISDGDFVNASTKQDAKDILLKAEEIGNVSHASLAKNASLCAEVLSC